MKAPEVSFLVPLYGRRDLTEQFVANLRATVPDSLVWEAVLINDASPDDTAAFIDQLPPPYRAIHLARNGGYARAMNRGAAAARASILVFLNNDLLLKPKWLEPMLDLLSLPNVGAVGNIQVNPATRLIDHAGVFFDPDGMPTHARKNRRRLPRGGWSEHNACTAACLAIPRAIFESFGGFCEEYRNGMEDIDLCVRLRASGQRILVSHRSVVGHLVSASPGRHENNAANTVVYVRRCAAVAASWGEREWPAAYLRRYARQWWKMDPARAARALRMLLAAPWRRNKNPVA